MKCPTARCRDRLGHAARRLYLEPLEERTLLSLGTFDILSPSGNIGDDTPEITWEASGGAYAYDLVVDDDRGLGSPLVEAEGLSGTSFTLTDPLAPDTYYVGVTARKNLPPVVDVGLDTAINEGSFFLRFGSFTDADATLQATNNGLEFVVVAPGPGEFSITGPIGQVTIETPTVTWEASERATTYDLVVSTNSDLSSPVQEHFDLTTTSHQVAPLANDTYYVGVTAEDGGGLTTDATNNGFDFTVAVSFPAPFSITGPLSPVETETPTVTWEASANAAGYDLIVASDMACANPIATYDNLAVTSQLLDPMANGTYYVCVTAFDNYNHEVTATNNGYAFNVLVLPPGPFLITGPASPVNAQSATITWQASERAVEYDLVVSTASDCSVSLGEDYPGLTGLSQETGTLANGTYYACVTARDDDGRTSTATNNGFSFEIAYVPPKYHNIFMTSTVYGIDPTMSFPPSSGGFGGLQAADYQCTMRAFRGGLVPGWDGITIVYQAILSSPTVNARDRNVIEGEIVNLAGELVAASGNDLWAGNLQNSVGYDEYGNPLGVGLDAWTGSFGDGTHSSSSCSGWSSTTGTGTTGNADSISTSWIFASSQTCNLSAHLYAISPPLDASHASSTGPGAPGDSLLTEAMIEPVLQDAMAYWAGQGIDPADIASQIGVAIANLGDTQLAVTTEGIDGFSLDRDAAQWGWSTADTVPAERIDLLSATVHEMGHLLGFEHGSYDVMAATLSPGDRPASLEAWTQAEPGASTARVDYGDGGGWEPLTLNPDGTFGLAHQYADNRTYSVTVEITDEHGAVGKETLELTVNNVAPTTGLETYDSYLDEGGSFTGSGVFFDPGADTWTVTVDYGDGSPVETVVYGEDNRYDLSHTYDQQGEYTVVVTVTDDDGGVGQTGRVVNVYNVTPEITSVEVNPAVIDEGGSVEVTGSFTDPGPEDTHEVTVHWGDGTEGPATVDPATRTFSLQHTYADDPAGTPDVYEITVSVRDTDTVVPEGFVEWGGHAYGLNDRAVCWEGVAADAHALSGNLVTLDSAEEQAFLVENILTDQPLWTGLHDFDDEGNFHWIGHEPLTYTNWAPGEPAAGEDFSYVLMDPAGTWSATGIWGDGGHYGVVEIVACDQARLEVTVNNVPPTLADAALAIVENSPGGTVVGTVTGTDPGDDTLTYSILGTTPFAIEPDTGEITVADGTMLDYETTPSLTVEVQVADDDGGTGTATVTIDLLNQASISGVVFVDVNRNGLYEANEPGIDFVQIELLDASGNLLTTTTTSDGGFYLFDDLDPGTYRIHEVQPTGVDDGDEILGSEAGTILPDDTMQLPLARIDAADYLFAELGQHVTSGDTATIGFWKNKHGQELIGQGGAALAAWLTDNLGNVFGNTFTDGVGSDDGFEVATFFKGQLFRQKSNKSAGPAKVDAQFMAVALATYFTSNDLAGNVAAEYGFNVTDTGIGTKVVNVGANGAAFGELDDTDLTIMQLLLATNDLTDNLTDAPDKIAGFAHIYDTDGDGVIDATEAALRAMANDVYSAINEQGDI